MLAFSNGLHAVTSGLSVGSMQNGSGAAESPFNGSIDDFRLYARALTNIELCTLANRPTTCLP